MARTFVSDFVGRSGRQERILLPRGYPLSTAEEVNKVADKEFPIIEQVLDIAERGQSLGVILIGAEQFMSAVHERAYGNAATMVADRSGSAELAANAYRFLD
ncbi:MAG: hypothetical protein ACPL7K_05650 [Armatimonadota bacterium]